MAVDTNLPAKADEAEALAKFEKPRLGWHPAIEERFGHIGVNKASWKSLIDACYPNAKTIDSVLLVLQYCDSRKLDPFKRPVNIVPMWSSVAKGMVDTVWPSIAELRTTAHRTKDYAGCDRIVWGPMVTKTFTGNVEQWENGNKAWKTITKEVTFPEYGTMTMYRMVQGHRVAFHGPEVYWEEAYATLGKSDVPNEMWESRARGQLEKCTEAAALRRAFPEEIGNTYAAEEMEGRSMWNVHEMRDITPKAEAAKQISADPPEPTRKAVGRVDQHDDKAAKQPDKKTEAKAKTEAKPDTKAAAQPAKEPAKPAEPDVDPDAYNITDYPAYADEFETKILECEGDIDAMLLVWKEHELYDDSLPIEFRTKCREIYQRAGGEFPE